jgi:prepilin-type N-terminal cleavage/methylation domain-containing protein
MKARRGFTMVEMLTVIVIIGMLAGITMKLMVYVNEKTAKARAASEIERIKHALIEYYSVYGIYPPCNGIAWEYERDIPWAKPDEGMGYYDGLATYLFDDPQKTKWSHFVDGLADNDTVLHSGSQAGAGVMAWSNNFCTLLDPWEREYMYTTIDPYQAFKFYSKGPDGVAGNGDDVGIKWNE